MSGKLIIEGEARSDVRFRFDAETAEALKALKERARANGVSLAIDEEVQRHVKKLVRQANKELDEIGRRESSTEGA
jgi:hypothetical protein